MAYTRTTWADYPTLTTPMNATRLNNMEVGIVSVTDTQTILEGVWTTYVPTWSAFSVAPAIGNGTLAGAYIRMGKLMICRVSMVAGTTTTFGTGFWYFGLPTPYAARAGNPSSVGSCYTFDSSAVTPYSGVCRADLNAPTVFEVYMSNNFVQSSTPFTWATSDELNAELIVELS